MPRQRTLPRRARPDRNVPFVPPLRRTRVPRPPTSRTTVQPPRPRATWPGKHKGRPATYAPNSWARASLPLPKPAHKGYGGHGVIARSPGSLGPPTTRRRGPDLL